MTEKPSFSLDATKYRRVVKIECLLNGWLLSMEGEVWCFNDFSDLVKTLERLLKKGD